MQRTGEQPVDLSVKEQKLLSTCSLARHHQRGARGETKGKAELPEIHDGILALMEKNLIPSTSTGESKVLYCKMKGDYYRYFAECATGDAKGKTAEGACVAHAEATKTSGKALFAIHPVRLGMALNTLSRRRDRSPLKDHGDSTVAVYRQGG